MKSRLETMILKYSGGGGSKHLYERISGAHIYLYLQVELNQGEGAEGDKVFRETRETHVFEMGGGVCNFSTIRSYFVPKLGRSISIFPGYRKF